jgi:polar amino acid transport system substrate-binding protein
MKRRDALMGISALTLGPAGASAATKAPLRLMAVELPPLIMATAAGSTGILVDLVRQLFARWGQPLQVEVVPWARAYADVVAGVGHALIPTIRNAEREKVLRFVNEPLFFSEMSFFRRADNPISWDGRLASLTGKRFVKLKGALFAPEFDQAVAGKRLNLDETTSFTSAVRMVNARRVDLAAIPKLAGLQIAASEGLKDEVVPLEPRVHLQPFHLALTRSAESEAWAVALERHLVAMNREGVAKALVEQYRQRQWLPPNSP